MLSNAEKDFITACGLNPNDFLPHAEKVSATPKETIVNISREDFSLLDATVDGVTYYIAEPNGTITMMRGDNR